MRAWQIALFIFLLNFSMTMTANIVDTSGNQIFFESAGYQFLHSSDYDRAYLNSTVQNLRGFEDASAADALFQGIKMVFQGFTTFVNVVIMSTIKVPLMLSKAPFNFPNFVVAPILGGMVLVYIAAIIEFFTGREVEN